MHVLMTCQTRLLDLKERVWEDYDHTPFGVYTTKEAADTAALEWKHDDEVSGCYFTKYWVVNDVKVDQENPEE